MRLGQLIPLTDLSQPVQEQVLAEYEARIRRPDHLLSYQEAALLYGFTYMSMRHLVHARYIHAVDTPDGPRLTHAEMERYTSTRGDRKRGRPRMFEAAGKLTIQLLFKN